VLPDSVKRKSKMPPYSKRWLIAAAAVAISAGLSTAASAQEWQQRAYIRPAAVIIITPGWHGDRYYDGHRYWARRDWEHRHRGYGYRHGRGHDRHDWHH
jgi:hypothetical protein